LQAVEPVEEVDEDELLELALLLEEEELDLLLEEELALLLDVEELALLEEDELALLEELLDATTGPTEHQAESA